MFGSVVLDVAIGMAFVFLLLSLVASTLQEFLATLAQSRSANLHRGLESLFSGGELAEGVSFVERIYNHGLVQGLYRDERDHGIFTNPPEIPAPVPQPGVTPTPPILPAGGRAPRRKLVSRNLFQWLMRVAPVSPLEGIEDLSVLPAYIPSRTFALALTDLLNKEHLSGPQAAQAIHAFLCQAVKDDPRNKAFQALLALANNSGDSLTQFQAGIEHWYNDAMDRVSGWYKKNTQYVLLGIGLVLAIALNVDAIRVAQTLWLDRDIRETMVAAAGKWQPPPSLTAGSSEHSMSNSTGTQSQDAQPGADAANAGPPQTPPASPEDLDAAATAQSAGAAAHPQQQLADQLRTEIAAFKDTTEGILPVGWNHTPSFHISGANGAETEARLLHIASVLAGWLITAFAISLGAAFWFDTLNKFMVVRSTIKPQEKSRVEGSKDATAGAGTPG